MSDTKQLEQPMLGQIWELLNKDKKFLAAVKQAAVKIQNYELASSLRQIERDTWVDAMREDPAYKEAKKFCGVLSMVKLNCDEKTAYKILEAAKLFNKKGGESDLDSATEINFKATEIFGEDAN